MYLQFIQCHNLIPLLSNVLTKFRQSAIHICETQFIWGANQVILFKL